MTRSATENSSGAHVPTRRHRSHQVRQDTRPASNAPARTGPGDALTCTTPVKWRARRFDCGIEVAHEPSLSAACMSGATAQVLRCDTPNRIFVRSMHDFVSGLLYIRQYVRTNVCSTQKLKITIRLTSPLGGQHEH